MTCARCGRPLVPGVPGKINNYICPDCQREAASAVQYIPQGSRPSLLTQLTLFPFTATLLALNILVFVAMLAKGLPVNEPTTVELLRWGADFGPLTLTQQPWRLISNMFVHAGIIHIGFNMWCFWYLGKIAERIFGGWTFLLIYLFSGIAGGLLSLLIFPMRVSVGASGAIFGAAGALIAALKLGKLPIPKQALSGTLRSLVAFAGYNLLFGAVSARIDNSAHLGGFGLGLLSGALLSRRLISDPETRALNRRIVFSFLAVSLVAAFWLVRRAHGL